MGTEEQEKSEHVSAKKKQLRLRALSLAALGLAVFLYIETQDHLPWEDGNDDEQELKKFYRSELSEIYVESFYNKYKKTHL